MSRLLPYRKDDPQRAINPYHISLTGETACGRSTCLNGLRTHFGKNTFHYLSVGGLMRNLAMAKGFQNIEAFAAYNRAHPEKGYDRECDRQVVEAAESHSHLICEGRLVHYFMEHAFHVFIKCDVHKRAERRAVQDNLFPDMALSQIRERDDDDRKRYNIIYPAGVWPDECFDLVLDSGVLGQHEIVQTLVAEHDAWVKRNMDRVLVGSEIPMSLVPC